MHQPKGHKIKGECGHIRQIMMAYVKYTVQWWSKDGAFGVNVSLPKVHDHEHQNFNMLH